jgi:hypothetical protein
MATIVAQATSNGTLNLTYALTCPVDTNLLVVAICSQNNPSGVTYNGVSMSVQVQAFGYFFADNWVNIYSLANPGTGSSHNVVVSGAGGPVSSTAFAISNINTSDFIDATRDTSPGSGSGITDTTITTNYKNSLIINCCVQHSGTTSNPAMATKYGATATFTDNPITNYKYGCSYQYAGAAGSQNIGWDDVVGRDGVKSVLGSFAIKSIPAGDGGSFLLSLLN